MATLIFAVKFLNEKNKNLKDVKRSTLWGGPFTRMNLCKRPELNSEPFQLWYGISNVYDMQLPVSSLPPASTKALMQKDLDFFQKLNLLVNIPSNSRNNMKSQIKKQKQPKFQFVELLIPTFNRSSSYQFPLALLEGKIHEHS